MELDLQEYLEKAIEGKIKITEGKFLVGRKIRINVGDIHFKPTKIIEACLHEDFIDLNLEKPGYLNIYMSISNYSNFNGIGGGEYSKFCIFYNANEDKVLCNEGVKIILPDEE